MKRLYFIFLLSVLPSIAFSEDEQTKINLEIMKNSEKTLKILDDSFIAKSKEQCIIAIPSHKFCDCLHENLGYKISFIDYLNIRTLPTNDEQIKYISNQYMKISGMNPSQEIAQKLISEINNLYKICDLN